MINPDQGGSGDEDNELGGELDELLKDPAVKFDVPQVPVAKRKAVFRKFLQQMGGVPNDSSPPQGGYMWDGKE